MWPTRFGRAPGPCLGRGHRAFAAGLCRPRRQEELSALRRALLDPERPVTAIVGGAKVSTKLDLLSNLITKVETLIIAGGMANTFLAAQGKSVGKSLVETDLIPTARDIMAKAKSLKREIVLPVDAVVAQKFAAHVPSRVVPVDEVGPDDMILDIGPRSIEQAISVLARSRSWSGTGRSALSNWSR